MTLARTSAPHHSAGAGGTATAIADSHIGLLLTAAIIGAWLAIHIGGIFFWRWSAADVPLVILVMLAQTWLSTGLFIVAHDAMHGALAPGRPRLNRAVGSVCLALYAGLSFDALLPKHTAHHRHAGTADDPDFDIDHPRRMVPWFTRFFRSYYSHGQMVRITIAVWFYVFALGATPANVVIFWAAPALLALMQLFVFGTYLPHRHNDVAFADKHRARSTDVSPLLSLLSCYHFGGYHHEHHLSPGTPWWRLPALRRRRAMTVAPALRQA